MPNLNDGFSNYLKKLDLPPDVERKIEDAQSTLEDALRVGLENFSASPQGGGVKYSPRFISQGSKVYGLLNMPCHTPAQQVDYDLGVHQPVSYHDKNNEPFVAAKEYFAVVKAILEPVVASRGWKLIEKTKCIRVQIDDLIHIDLPLYSMPDKEHLRFTEAMRGKGLIKAGQSENFRMDDQRDFWDEFAFDKVMLCLSNGSWLPSDPRKMTKEVRETAWRLGVQAKPVWRCLKGWRDHLWPSGDGPASLYMMFAACGSYDPNAQGTAKALLAALQGFSYASTAKVLTPSGEDLGANQDPKKLEKLAQAARLFAADLQTAIDRGLEDGYSEQLIAGHLGNRFPVPPQNSGSARPVMSAEEKVRQIDKHVSQQPVGRPYFIYE